MTPTEQITASLETLFAELDAEVLAASLEWIAGRVKALHAFETKEEYTLNSRNAWALYPRLYAIAGGKTWYNIIVGRTPAMREEFVTKNCAAIARKRNAAIAAKAVKAGATSVDGEEFARTSDGFNGMFVLNTDVGRKVVSINTIRAGGHNIQCLHLRVLVKVK